MSKPKWATDFENESFREDRKPLVLRKRIRYLLSRLQRVATVEGADVPKLPKGFKKHFEDQEWFDGWENWGVTWDVGTPMRSEEEIGGNDSDDPLVVVPRYMSLNEEWDEFTDSHHRQATIRVRKRLAEKRMEERKMEEADSGIEDHV